MAAKTHQIEPDYLVFHRPGAKNPLVMARPVPPAPIYRNGCPILDDDMRPRGDDGR